MDTLSAWDLLDYTSSTVKAVAAGNGMDCILIPTAYKVAFLKIRVCCVKFSALKFLGDYGAICVAVLLI